MFLGFYIFFSLNLFGISRNRRSLGVKVSCKIVVLLVMIIVDF